MRAPFIVADYDKEIFFRSKYLHFCYDWEHENYLIDDQYNPLIVTAMSGSTNLEFSINFAILIVRSKFAPDQFITTSYKATPGESVPLLSILESAFPFKTDSISLLSKETKEDIVKLDNVKNPLYYKFGVIYMGPESLEELTFDNGKIFFYLVVGSFDFEQFLTLLGKRVELKGFKSYSGGLDVKDETTGKYSIYNKYKDVEIMFHVSTYLANSKGNDGSIETWKHIGNDIVTIVFLDGACTKFDLKKIFPSKFLQVFIVVRKVDNDSYVINIVKNGWIPSFDPPTPFPAIVFKNDLTEFLLKKMINAEQAAYLAPSFNDLIQRQYFDFFNSILQAGSNEPEKKNWTNLLSSRKKPTSIKQ